MLAAPPACLALGFIGVWGTPEPWAGPASMSLAVAGGLSLESWRGWPAWLLWIWASGPAAVALVAIATAAVRDRIEPAWRDAARLAGAGPFRTWRSVTWPLIRPAAARAAAIVFPLALLEPGVPLILGLRRTLAFQIVEAAARPAPFPRIAVWTAMAAAISIAARWIIRWFGGPPLLEVAGDGAPAGKKSPGAGALVVIAAGLLVAVSVTLGWLPVLGLARILASTGTDAGGPMGLAVWSPSDILRRASSRRCRRSSRIRSSWGSRSAWAC